MAPEQQLFARAAAELVVRLANPPCVDAAGAAVPSQPESPLDACPAGSARERPPATDMNVGVISSSLGGLASDACPSSETSSCPGGATNVSRDDRGHLLSRSGPCTAETIPTYQGAGFLAWDVAQVRVPVGEATLGEPDGTTGLAPAVRDLVLGVGSLGCGYPMPLEATYRFLADPDPYETVAVGLNGTAVATGTDTALLAQRKAFLRPDSLLLVVLASDGDDCSTKAYGQFYFALQQANPSNPGIPFRLPAARSECATNPADPCCLSCGQATPAACPADPTCAAAPSLTAAQDDVALRCWNQKQRFGIDFLYPLDRYGQALSTPLLPDRSGNLVANPIFSDLDPADAVRGMRDPGFVFLATFAGVPWQDLAVDPADPASGVRDAAALTAPDGTGHSRWEFTAGDLAQWVQPLDPHMIQSTAPRTGTNAVTGTDLAPPGSAFGADPISGHEFTPAAVPDALQLACVFDLAAPIDCTGTSPCACTDPLNDLPVCSAEGGAEPTFQVRGEARPARRTLTLLRSLGSQGVAASICPANGLAPADAAFGFRPGVAAILRDVAPAMAR
jgi:hypothetical protein